MGGTFDPIHNGHLAIARAAMDAMALDRVLFIPDYLPPHKAAGWAPAGDRMAMTLLATMDEPRFFGVRYGAGPQGPFLYSRYHADPPSSVASLF